MGARGSPLSAAKLGRVGLGAPSPQPPAATARVVSCREPGISGTHGNVSWDLLTESAGARSWSPLKRSVKKTRFGFLFRYCSGRRIDWRIRDNFEHWSAVIQQANSKRRSVSRADRAEIFRVASMHTNRGKPHPGGRLCLNANFTTARYWILPILIQCKYNKGSHNMLPLTCRQILSMHFFLSWKRGLSWPEEINKKNLKRASRLRIQKAGVALELKRLQFYTHETFRTNSNWFKTGSTLVLLEEINLIDLSNSQRINEVTQCLLR